MRPDDSFQIEDFRRRNFRWIDQRQWAISGLQYLIVSHDGSPLQRKTNISSFPFIKSRMNPVLKVTREGNLRLFLLFGEHFHNMYPYTTTCFERFPGDDCFSHTDSPFSVIRALLVDDD